MEYCINCGKALEIGVKFCAYCGSKVLKNADQIKNPLKKKIHKGVAKSLNDRSRSEENEIIEVDISTSSLLGTTIVVYFILNLILIMGNPNSDELMGIFIYTWIVLAIIFIRRNKDKVFNWLLNIFVSLQAVLVFATIMVTLGYLDSGADSAGTMIQLGLLVFLLMIIGVLLYKGNRRSS